MMTLVIDSILLNALIVHAERDHPAECCGILVGRQGDGATSVLDVVPSPNISDHDRQCHFQIDWQTLLQTQRSARANGREIIGFYHSHPSGSIRPSLRDADIAWSNCLYLILALSAGRVVDWAAWRLDSSSQAEERQPGPRPWVREWSRR